MQILINQGNEGSLKRSVLLVHEHYKLTVMMQKLLRRLPFHTVWSAYQTPPKYLPITESTGLHNPYWKYSRDKIACEEYLILYL